MQNVLIDYNILFSYLIHYPTTAKKAGLKYFRHVPVKTGRAVIQGVLESQ